jgi:anti-anti-sigma factor
MSIVSGTTFAYSLRTPVDEEALAALRDAVTAAAQAGAKRCVVAIDVAPALDSPLIKCLVRTLRDIREVGADLVLATARADIRQTLAVSGLDKVFAVDVPRDDDGEIAEPQPRPRRRRTRIAPAILAAALAVLALAGSARAEGEQPTPATIVQRIVEMNPSLSSYRARVRVAVAMQSFPWLAPNLEGTTYFKRPNNYEVVFEHVPTYAKGFDRLYSDIGDPTNWERRFTMTVVGNKDLGGHRDLVLRLVQKVRGMIDHQDVAVDPSAWRIDEMEWHYYNGGVITMTQDFQTSGPWTVLAAQHAVIRIPHVRAVADAHYDDYRTNVAIDDAVFTGKSR